MRNQAVQLVALDPRDEGHGKRLVVAPRPPTLDGKVIGLLANNKPHSEELLRMIVDVIKERYSVKGVVEYNKGGHQWPADPEALQKLAGQCDVMVHATAE